MWTLVFNFPPIALEGTKALCITGKQIVSKGWDKGSFPLIMKTNSQIFAGKIAWRKTCNLSFFQGRVMFECNCEMRRSKVE